MRSIGAIETTIETSGIPCLIVPSPAEASAEIAMEIDILYIRIRTILIRS